MEWWGQIVRLELEEIELVTILNMFEIRILMESGPRIEKWTRRNWDNKWMVRGKRWGMRLPVDKTWEFQEPVFSSHLKHITKL